MQKVNEISKWLEDVVTILKEEDCNTTFKLELDKDLALYVGWEDGFDIMSEDLIHSQADPEWCVCVKIGENIKCFAYMPWDKNEEVYDTDNSLSLNPDFDKIAQIYVNEYNNIRRLLDNNELTFNGFI